MLTSQDRLIARGRLAGNAAQAEALAKAGELSVLIALRRDMKTAPAEDHFAENWASALQQAVELETGRYAVAVTDANSRFDVNRLAIGGLGDIQTLGRLMAALDLPADYATRIAAGIARGGALGSIDQLADLGLPPDAIAALRPHLETLPVAGNVNLNTVGQVFLGVLLNNPAAANRLIRLRDTNGRLTAADLAQMGVLAPPGSGYTSDVWDVVVSAETDGTQVRLTSRLVRFRGPGVRDVVVTSRRFGPEAGEIPGIPAQ